jgi:hypothetical protein
MRFNLSNSLLVLLALPSVSQAVSRVGRADELIGCLTYSLSSQGSIVLPDEPSFTDDTARFSEYDSPTFRVVSKVSSEDDVRASVCGQLLNDKPFECINSSKINCATKTETPFLVTGLRHGFDVGLDKRQNGLQIWTEGFSDIKVHAEANTMMVGGSVSFKDVVEVLYAARKNIRELTC